MEVIVLKYTMSFNRLEDEHERLMQYSISISKECYTIKDKILGVSIKTKWIWDKILELCHWQNGQKGEYVVQ
jgi:hypothetical protein